MIVGTAGHIDHGKTALVKALTGVDADRLAEEKVRGITIDLGFAYRRLPTGETLGFDAVTMGDVDGDGAADLLITAAWSGINGYRSGRVFIVSSAAAARQAD